MIKIMYTWFFRKTFHVDFLNEKCTETDFLIKLMKIVLTRNYNGGFSAYSYFCFAEYSLKINAAWKKCVFQPLFVKYRLIGTNWNRFNGSLFLRSSETLKKKLLLANWWNDSFSNQSKKRTILFLSFAAYIVHILIIDIFSGSKFGCV